ncbi:hypothetical protein QCA50_014078 [Cerrena zonata]|uniref:Fungal-type protein kinase domain-containing protein n=1 Tax=Cerrena zonata TaxID=2478898 RepID=A0AAW0FN03_9APHY
MPSLRRSIGDSDVTAKFLYGQVFNADALRWKVIKIPCLIPVDQRRTSKRFPVFESILGPGVIHDCVVIGEDNDGNDRTYHVAMRFRQDRKPNKTLRGLYNHRLFPVDIAVMAIGIRGHIIGTYGSRERRLARSAIRAFLVELHKQYDAKEQRGIPLRIPTQIGEY